MTWNLSNVISGVGEVLLDPRLECSPHVDAGVGHRLALAAVRLEEIREFLHRRRVLAVGDVDHLAPRHVDEQADIIVAAPRRSLVGGDPTHLRQIQLLHRPPDVMSDNHGVATLRTPHCGHVTLGVRACNSVRCWKKSRCRQVSSFVS